MSALPTPRPAPRPRPATRRRLAAMAATAALLLLTAACGGDDDGNVVADVTEDSDLPTQSAPTTIESAEGKECQEATDIPEAEGKPDVEMPVGETPTELQQMDITPGDGAEAELGKAISVHYVGVACSTGMQFDSSWDREMPADFTLTEGQLIEGWTEGIPGMKVGGRRMLVIPSDLAYGPEGNQGIAPDEALVFVIDLLEVSDAPPEGEAPAPPPEGEAPAEGETTVPPEGDAPGEGDAPAEGETTVPAEGEGDAPATTAAEG
ncbi:MAG TPA: FKBP-type peptidyl-prolyl cis-trans isomerase [Iamia sp.]|nr:FKBP-type peptidyl-prolyl cis-trans isomerase [Iamia sp.]HXH58396.1 FKBP-type peptidyl-prolyl cis-trans isomerase [Iamia sp.]